MHRLTEWFDYLSVPPAAAIGTIAIPIVAAIIIALASRAVRRLASGLQARVHLPDTTVQSVTRVFAALLWICAGFLVLNAWGVGIGGLWTVLLSVITAVGVGFLAVWTMISNITASLFVTIWRPFHIGQMVEILPEQLRGHVSGRNLMFTSLRQDDGAMLYVPNNFFFQKMFRVSDGAADPQRAAAAPTRPS